VLEVASRHVRIAAGEGAVDLLQVRPAGRKDMDGASFARGRRLAPGDSLERPPVVPELDLAAPAAR
jgi:methionyl-tRNA formyltransferase